MKRILILGGFGFVGTNLIKFIDDYFSEAYSVVVFDKLPKHPYGETFRCVERVYAGDFSDIMVLKSIFKENKIDMVIHSIISTVPAYSYNARYDIESNLIPTIEFLNLMIENATLDIIFISSGGAVYGESEQKNKHKESDNLFPVSSYGVVKLAIEKYMMQYALLYNLRPLILRLSNPYGRFHYSEKQGICNVALRSALQGKKITVWGTGEATKDYIYINDFCDILFQLYRQSIHSVVLNVGSGSVLSLNEILNEIKALVPDFSWNYVEASKFDVSNFELNVDKLKNIIGNYSYTTFETGLSEIKDWQRNNNNK